MLRTFIVIKIWYNDKTNVMHIYRYTNNARSYLDNDVLKLTKPSINGTSYSYIILKFSRSIDWKEKPIWYGFRKVKSYIS